MGYRSHEAIREAQHLSEDGTAGKEAPEQASFETGLCGCHLILPLEAGKPAYTISGGISQVDCGPLSRAKNRYQGGENTSPTPSKGRS